LAASGRGPFCDGSGANLKTATGALQKWRETTGRGGQNDRGRGIGDRSMHLKVSSPGENPNNLIPGEPTT
jgi:hypothetical protein